ncbi:MAG TPA: amino acid transporter [Chloroflexota bacterium]|nr:amino acid transporter [Chloroflexota bacterium]
MRWLTASQPVDTEGPFEPPTHHAAHPWWQVMCLTGVDYFSSLGYSPGIAALAAGVLAPVATLILVLVTLFGLLPTYRVVARESPHGEGSIALLERLLPWWQGKVFVLCLVGFAATAFVITITLSAADAAEHLVKNPFLQGAIGGQNLAVTLFLILVLGAVFLKGFSEAIAIAVTLVFIYLPLNVITVGAGIFQVLQHPHYAFDWRAAVTVTYGDPLIIVGISLLLFPRLALGMSGFETGVMVMPLVKGNPNDNHDCPEGRIQNTRKLLFTAALIMSVMLITSSFVTILLTPPAAFQPGGEANGRALAYIAHEYLGNTFGTLYDISSILILWFAGASAMAGLLHIVPRYLPRYGMAPDWARATRPLVLIFMVICLAVTFIFNASVDAQAGAYATGILVLMTTATVSVSLLARRRGARRAFYYSIIITVIFVYASITNIIERPEGLLIAAVFIVTIVATSLISRAFRSTELRITRVVLDPNARRFLDEAARDGVIRIIANHPDERDSREYLLKEREEREANHIPPGDPVIFFEVEIADASDFATELDVKGEEIGGFHVLTARFPSIPNAIAAFLLYVRNVTGCRPHAYFGWTEGNPISYILRFIFFGEGDIAPVTREILREAEKDRKQRPAIHIG